MEILLNQDQALTISNLLVAAIANKELQGVKAIQERETLWRVKTALFINECKELKAAI